MESNAFSDLIRGFFAGIVKFLYQFFSGAIDLMYNLASLDFGFDNYIDKIADKIFNILIIFMLFKVTFSMLNYLVNPDNVSDNSKGLQNVIKRIIITIVMLISINPIFEFLTDLQKDIIDSEVIASILGNTDEGNVLQLTNSYGDIQYAYGVQMHPECEQGKYVYTFSKGDHMALLLLKPFIQPYSADEITAVKYQNAIEKMNEPEGYCGMLESEFKSQELVNVAIGENTKEGFRLNAKGPNSAEGFMYKKYYAGQENDTYIYDFNYFFALVAGLVGLLIVVSFCFDIVIRSCTLVLLKLIAPIPIISYISPQGKSSEMFGTWLKKLGSVWVSLFIRIAVLSIAISLIGAACEAMSKNNNALIIQIFVILGILMFAKKLPGLLEELLPGLKLSGGFELNPFKRISKDALGGNLALGAGAAVTAAGLGAATNGIHRGASFFNKKTYMDKDGNITARSALTGFGRNLGRTAGSTIAGATRSGVNAFGRTSKDGKMLGGMWNGYQTAMYSKIQREDNLRKAGLEDATLGQRIKFAAGSAVSDATRYVGVLNKGQREYLQASKLDNDIKDWENKKVELAMQKHKDLEPYVEYSNYASKIKDKIDNESSVKLAKQMLEDAQASGNEQDILAARRIVEDAEIAAGKKLLREDNEVRAYTRRLDEIRKNCTELQNEKYNYINSKGEFSKGSIYNTKSEANVREMRYAVKEKEYDIEIDKIKNSKVYKETHDENSIAKIQNASRMNKEVQPPGLKPSAAPMQSKMTDSSQFSNLDD